MWPYVRLVPALLVVGCSRAPTPDRSASSTSSGATPVEAPDAAASRDARVALAAPDATPVEAPDASVPAPALAIIDAPMAWGDERAQLTLSYRRAHSDPDAADLAIDPRVIVLHYTGGGSARGTRGYFDQVRVEASRTQLRKAGAVNVSAHFVVDRDGTIYQLQPTTRFARHCIGLNHTAIGIENVGDERQYPLTDAQVISNAALVRHLVRLHPVTHLLGHHEVMGLRAHPYYVELDRAYANSKPDPGRRFMTRVRAEVVDLELRGS